MSQGNDGSLSTIHANSSLEVFNRIATYALQANERLPVEATHMLISGSINFVVFLRKRNDYHAGGRMNRVVESIREVTGVDGRVLSSEIFTAGRDGQAVPHASISCIDDLVEQGYESDTLARWS
jgi:Flp pilus assembly CpaF family ATPase